MKRRFFLSLLSWIILGPPLLHAQFIGFTQPQTVTQSVATNLNCTGSPQIFAINNLGQTEHYLAVGGTGVTSMSARIEGLRNGQTFKMSDTMSPGVGAVGSVFASGFYPQIQVSITCNPTSATFTAGYTGTSSTPYLDVGDYLLSSMDRTILNGAPAATNAASFFQTPYGNSQGAIYVQYAGATAAGGTITVACSGNSASPNSLTTVALFTSLASTTSGQSFPVPAQNCSFVTVSFGNSGAAGVVTVDYVFAKAGFAPSTTGLSLSSFLGNSATPTTGPGNWTVVSAPAAGSQATATQAAGTGTLRHVANCITWSAGAAAAPAATTLTINLRDGATGAGTILWSTNITAAATAANHGNISFCGLNRVGSAATAMTLEFAAGLANESESVTLSGYDVQ